MASPKGQCQGQGQEAALPGPEKTWRQPLLGLSGRLGWMMRHRRWLLPSQRSRPCRTLRQGPPGRTGSFRSTGWAQVQFLEEAPARWMHSRSTCSSSTGRGGRKGRPRLQADRYQQRPAHETSPRQGQRRAAPPAHTAGMVGSYLQFGCRGHPAPSRMPSPQQVSLACRVAPWQNKTIAGGAGAAGL